MPCQRFLDGWSKWSTAAERTSDCWMLFGYWESRFRGIGLGVLRPFLRCRWFPVSVEFITARILYQVYQKHPRIFTIATWAVLCSTCGWCLGTSGTWIQPLAQQALVCFWLQILTILARTWLLGQLKHFVCGSQKEHSENWKNEQDFFISFSFFAFVWLWCET